MPRAKNCTCSPLRSSTASSVGKRVVGARLERALLCRVAIESVGVDATSKHVTCAPSHGSIKRKSQRGLRMHEVIPWPITGRFVINLTLVFQPRVHTVPGKSDRLCT